MRALFKYAVVVVLGLAVGFYIRAPLSVEESARFNWLDEVNVIINKALEQAKPKAAVVTVDPARAALIDEELDYRIAQGIASLDGWRTFLAVHGNGVYAQSARAQAERLLAATAPAPATAEVPNGASEDANVTSDRVGSAPSSPGMEVATLTPDEICNRDGDRLERLRSSPTSDEAARFVNELGCDKLRPQLLALTESLGYASPAPAAAPPSPSAKVGTAPGPRRRATVPPSKMRWTASPRGVQPRRHANRCAFTSVCFWRDSSPPAILLALLGEKPKHSSASRRALTYPRPNDFRGR
jgi:hypothetical protein